MDAREPKNHELVDAIYKTDVLTEQDWSGTRLNPRSNYHRTGAMQ